MLRASALSVLCAAVALIAGGCGESGSAGGDDGPSSLVPAGTAVYLEAAVRPEGDRRENALAAAGKIMGTDDPATKLRELVDKGLAEEGLTWERDFAPWLGEDAGVWATNFQAAEPSWAAIVESTDAEAAKAALGRFEKASPEDGPYKAGSYGGVEYRMDAERVAAGVVDDFVVFGSEDAFKRVVDTRDGASLADEDRYNNVIGELEDERLGHYYVDIAPLVDAAAKQDPEAARNLQQFKSFFPVDKLGPITGAFAADGDGMTLDTVATGVPEGPFRNLAQMWSGDGSELLGELPGDAWAAFVLPKLGESADSLLANFAGALGGAAIAAQVKQATGLDLQEDIFSWVGDVGLLVRGTDTASLDGALVIGSRDDARAEAAFAKLVGLIGKETGAPPEPIEVAGADTAFAIAAPGAPKKVVIARGEGRVVAAFGEPAAAAALSPSAKLGDSDGFSAAREILGDDMDPAFLLSIADVIRVADATGGTDAEFDKARPYLEALGVVTSGGSTDGDRVQSRVAVTLK